MKMKRIALLVVFLLVCAGVGAQGMERVREELARPDAVGGARVEVIVQTDAASAVDVADHTPRPEKITSYRVSLFRDNSQTAGANVRAVAMQFREMFPGIHVDVRYESPYFEAVAGNFMDRTDAVALSGKVVSRFPKAVVVQEEIAVSGVVWSQNRSTLPSEDENNRLTD